MSEISERLYLVGEVCLLFRISTNSAGRLLRGRPGVLNVSTGPGRPSYRIPGSVVINLLVERGFTYKQAEDLLRSVPRMKAKHA